VEALTGFATDLASALVLALAGRLGHEVLGDEQERTLKDVLQRATAAMLVELAREDVGNRQMLERHERQFRKVFEDRWVARTLVGVALDSEPPPVGALRDRFSSMGFNPHGLPISFDRAIGVFVLELMQRLDEEASKGGSLAPLVNRSNLKAIRRSVEDIAQDLGSTGPDVDEIERESLARCVERWEAVGLPPEEARALAAE
jgi:hypothetical protein